MLDLKQGGMLRGNVDKDHFRILIALSSIHSDKVMLSLRDYLVYGHSRRDVCNRYKLNNGYFSVSLARLMRISQLVALAVPYYTESHREWSE
ncbi:transcriptional regulator [Escherichia coli]|nr:transcriptional regulator [Escherichia coli]